MDINTALESGKFTLTALTAAINNVVTPRTRIQELGLFEEDGIRTTTVDIEYKDGQIQLVQDVERGADGEPLDDPDRNIFTFRAIHLPVPGRVMADDIQNTRTFGELDELEELQTVINGKLELARQSLEITIEYFRIGAIFGKVYGKDGKLKVDLFKVFGIKEIDGQNTVDFNKALRAQLRQVKRDSEKNQKGVKAKGYRALCRPAFFDALLEDPDFYKAFERQQDGQALREDVRTGVYWDGIWWEEYDEKLGDKDPMPEAYGAVVFPTNKPGMYLTRFAPANYNETVNTKGLPFYTAAETLDFGKGVKTESQTNPINVCTSPLAVRRIKFVPKAAA